MTIATIAQVVGAILAVYAVGQLILAFKREDPNLKKTATLLLLAGIFVTTTFSRIKLLL